mmetsp:Transcript_41006/g.80275  ORF Transcript_41006/g.80275 Transcript_41006/m.80275 type:complete len:515 (+) Transcript_41006:115-1659(+)
MSISHSIELRTKAGALSHVFPPSSAAPPPPPASAKYAIHPVTGSVLPLPHDGLTHAYYSPTGRYLVGFTGSSIVVRDTESGDDDAVPISFPFGGKIRADKSAASGGAVGCVRNASCYDSGSNWPTLVQFSKDERVAMRIGTKNELHFYLLGGGAEAPTAVRVRIKDVSFAVLDAESSPSGASVLTFVAGNRNVPARASLFSGIVLEGAAGVLTPPPPPSSKSQIADEASLSFSRSGRSGLALMSTSVDRTGASYYGSTFAILLNAKGAETVAPPKAEGPVHALRWHPTREEFVVCAGAQPSCSALYDATGCQTYSFGTSHRNTVCFSPHSNLLALGGFGNLAGGVSVFHLSKRSVVTQMADFKTGESRSQPWVEPLRAVLSVRNNFPLSRHRQRVHRLRPHGESGAHIFNGLPLRDALGARHGREGTAHCRPAKVARLWRVRGPVRRHQRLRQVRPAKREGMLVCRLCGATSRGALRQQALQGQQGVGRGGGTLDTGGRGRSRPCGRVGARRTA